eukprot:NODE_1484_length_972_cov_0.210767.p1 type:complete len:154 gc:universal NODE_1484_length_972_cov_0.210767:660-199(-)
MSQLIHDVPETTKKYTIDFPSINFVKYQKASDHLINLSTDIAQIQYLNDLNAFVTNGYIFSLKKQYETLDIIDERIHYIKAIIELLQSLEFDISEFWRSLIQLEGNGDDQLNNQGLRTQFVTFITFGKLEILTTMSVGQLSQILQNLRGLTPN